MDSYLSVDKFVPKTKNQKQQQKQNTKSKKKKLNLFVPCLVNSSINIHCIQIVIESFIFQNLYIYTQAVRVCYLLFLFCVFFYLVLLLFTIKIKTNWLDELVNGKWYWILVGLILAKREKINTHAANYNRINKNTKP